jgi:7,8-dihydropterin-6-yl-methyl-4-(beta-D-ribofuranosyl)aminobenzene 5'-phosphate synthase
LNLDPQAIDVVVLSHVHSDHTGGLKALLETGARPTVYVPAAFPASFKEEVRTRTALVEVTDPIEILPGVYTTGQVGSGIVEQALAVKTGEGLVVVTGCAHPGVVEMVRRAREALPSLHPSPYQGEGVVTLVMGGFHLKDTGQAQIEAIMADLRSLGVQRVAPCHCTGDRARQIFAEVFGAEFFPAGAGWTITFRAK